MSSPLPNFPANLLITSFTRNQAANRPIIFGILAVATIQMLLVIVGPYADGTWYLPAGDKGLFVHCGAWATIITDPLLMISSASAYEQFRYAITKRWSRLSEQDLRVDKWSVCLG